MNALTLGRLRFTVQIVMLFVGIYGSALVGHYMADKISDALPALSCAYSQENGAYCSLISTQHILHHRVGQSIVRLQGFSFNYLIPLAFTLLTFFAFFVVLSKAFCAWICPLGTVQEIVSRIGRKLNLPINRFERGNIGKVRPIKWIMLVGLVFVLPLLAGLGQAPHAAGDSFCQICPSRMVATLATGNLESWAIPMGQTADFLFAAVRSTLFGFIVIAALSVRQPFCRICPMLAMNSIAYKIAPLRLVKKQNDRCVKCGLCEQACPMDIHEIATTFGSKAYHEDCTLCGRCAEFCPDADVIQIKFGPVPLFKSSKAYFSKRTRIDKPDSTPRPKPKLRPKKAS